MKRTILTLLAFSVALSFGSCKRDYICRCTGGIAKSGYDVKFENINYGKAKSDCKNYSSNTNGPDAINCELLTN